MSTPLNHQDYSQLIARLYAVNRLSGCQPGLRNMQALNQLLGAPEKAFPSIHVAGTNGKGSVTTKIARALQLSGYRVGCYTSPHISCFRERIQVDGVWISEEEVQRELSSILQIADREQVPATFFELTTALAFAHFARAQVDAAVLETGLGGRFDATNCVTPVLSVITSVALDHTDILGVTREQIAWEKGGIIKPGVPVIAGPNADLPIVHQLAAEQRSSLQVVPALSGDFDAENSAVARQALIELNRRDFCISDREMQAGLQCRPSCRFERVPTSVLQQSGLTQWPENIILDVAHNPDAMRKLVDALDQHYPGQPYDFVCGFSKSKDVASCLRILKPKLRHLHLVHAQHERALDLAALRNVAQEVGLGEGQLKTWDVPAMAIEVSCREAARENAVVVVCGSFFIMAEVRVALGYREPRDMLNLNEHLQPALIQKVAKHRNVWSPIIFEFLCNFYLNPEFV